MLCPNSVSSKVKISAPNGRFTKFDRSLDAPGSGLFIAPPIKGLRQMRDHVALFVEIRQKKMSKRRFNLRNNNNFSIFLEKIIDQNETFFPFFLLLGFHKKCASWTISRAKWKPMRPKAGLGVRIA